MSTVNRIILAYWHNLLKNIDNSKRTPAECQHKTFSYLMKNGSDSFFGKEHKFSAGTKYEDFAKNVPVRSYNQLNHYIERLRNGENYVLWNQKVRWFAKSSGTSSDKSKFIPITPDNLRICHYGGFQTMLASYIDNNPKSKLFSGKSLTLGGSIQYDGEKDKNIFSGDLSAILLENSPRIAEVARVPEKSTALISSFDKKLAIICRECSGKNVTNFAGVPSWNLIMIRKLLAFNNVEHLTDIWPNLELFMHGGISFDPYREQYEQFIPKEDMHYLENYNASEGYFAFQDDLKEDGMLLTLSNGVFYEFIPLDIFESLWKEDNEGSKRVEEFAIPLEGVSPGVPYAIIISTNSGLWRYMIGDCVIFTSTSPYKIKIYGRTQMFINAFGEELMIGNAEKALASACKICNLSISDYTVAPIFMDNGHRGAHEWVIEPAISRKASDDDTIDYEHFADVLDMELCKCNSDYEAKRTESETMSRLVLTVVPAGTFYRWMESRGKIGGQNKVPRLSNTRKYVEELKNIK